MSSLIYSVNVIAPIFIVALLGYFLKRIGLIGNDFIKSANSLCFNIGFPLLIFKDISTQNMADFYNLNFVIFILAAALIMPVISIIIVVSMVKDKRKHGALIQSTFRGSVTMLGIPLIINMFTDNGIGPFALMLAIVVPIYNIASVVILSCFSENKVGFNLRATLVQIAKNPFIIAIVISLVFSTFSIRLPVILSKTVDYLAAFAMPIALLILGASTSFISMKNNFLYVIWATIGRLVVSPAIMLPIAVMMGFRSAQLGAIFILASTPTVIVSQVMAQKMGNDHELAGQIILSTTFFSLFSLTAIIFILKSFSLI